ncbi:MAG: hypothetical protein KatS3mg111_0632 [Pirellulaceae bacterium]|nr:MAG: hypothetical protein KatS3mg111_0632 [Pirellulaceae bacterium]
MGAKLKSHEQGTRRGNVPDAFANLWTGNRISLQGALEQQVGREFDALGDHVIDRLRPTGKMPQRVRQHHLFVMRKLPMLFGHAAQLGQHWTSLQQMTDFCIGFEIGVGPGRGHIGRPQGWCGGAAFLPGLFAVASRLVPVPIGRRIGRADHAVQPIDQRVECRAPQPLDMLQPIQRIGARRTVVGQQHAAVPGALMHSQRQFDQVPQSFTAAFALLGEKLQREFRRNQNRFILWERVLGDRRRIVTGQIGPSRLVQVFDQSAAEVVQHGGIVRALEENPIMTPLVSRVLEQGFQPQTAQRQQNADTGVPHEPPQVLRVSMVPPGPIELSTGDIQVDGEPQSSLVQSDRIHAHGDRTEEMLADDGRSQRLVDRSVPDGVVLWPMPLPGIDVLPPSKQRCEAYAVRIGEGGEGIGGRRRRSFGRFLRFALMALPLQLASPLLGPLRRVSGPLGSLQQLLDPLGVPVGQPDPYQLVDGNRIAGSDFEQSLPILRCRIQIAVFVMELGHLSQQFHIARMLAQQHVILADGSTAQSDHFAQLAPQTMVAGLLADLGNPLLHLVADSRITGCIAGQQCAGVPPFDFRHRSTSLLPPQIFGCICRGPPHRRNGRHRQPLVCFAQFLRFQ